MFNIIKIKKLIIFFGDLVLLLASLPATLLIAFGKDFSYGILADHFFPFLVIYSFILILFYINGLYDIRRFKSATLLLPTIFIIHGIGLLLGIVLFYLTTDLLSITPKTNLVMNMIIAATFIWIWRALFQRFFAKYIKIKIAIAGINEHAKELSHIINTRPYLGYELSALITTEPLFDASAARSDVKTFLADKNLVRNLKENKIDSVITAENTHINPLVAQAFYECIPYKIQFLDLAQGYEILTGRVPISYINQAWFLENINEQQKKLYDSLKRVFDIMAGSVLFAVFLPLWPLIALAIKWESKGPVFYSQERVGINKKLFILVKFRSMINDAEQGKAVWAQKKDPRVTKVGAFLRRTHLDELPQMINVARGDISLVGPRPERTEFVEELERQIPHYNIRHIIKPGFTGWAQVNFRYARTPSDTYEKFQYDLYYLKNRSFVLDVAIMLRTLNLFFKRQAHAFLLFAPWSMWL